MERSRLPRTVAFATHAGAPRITDDDRLAASALAERHGVRVEPAPWDAAEMGWDRYAAVLVRSTWNYHRRPADFLAWATGVAESGAALWNPASVIRWNADKAYLRELERAGVPVVPTEWIVRGSDADARPVLAARGWRRAVLKPSVSATAFRTTLLGPGLAEDAQACLVEILEDSDALLQPLLSEVYDVGEWSFLYFAEPGGGLVFSHAVVKRPARGDFRVQSDFGGSVVPATPSAGLMRQVDPVAATIDRIAPGPLLYARLDGAVSQGAHAPPGTFLLMEAELIEPALFLAQTEEGAGRFAWAIAARLAVDAVPA